MLRGKVMEETIQSIMVQLASQGMIFPGDDILQPLTSEALESNTAANMKKHAYGRQIIHHTLTCLGLNDTPQDPVWFQHICNVVSTRFAQLCGAGLAAVIDWMLMDCHASESIRVGVNGQLYKTGLNFSQFQKTVVDMSPSCPVTFQPLSHSPEIGTALVTAVLSKINTIETFLKPLQLSEEVLQEVQAKMRQEMERGLQKETRESSFLKMLPTYICNKPAGNETGQFIVLELGGKDMHIVYVRIGDKREEERLPIRKTYNLPQHLMHGTGEEVHNLGGNKMYLSFVFPFACKQTALNEGSLIKWTKGFAASDCEKKNVVELLERAIKQKTELNMSVIALVNDTTSTMMAGCYEDEKCDIGLIVGTGTNSCYMEEKKNIPMEMENMSGQMCVNMEWGAFGDNGCLDNIITNFDLDVDNSSVNPKKQRFEKMIGGMYLGEIVRHVLNGLTRNGLLLKNSTLEKNLLELDHLCSIEREEHSLDLCSALMSRGLKCNEDEAKKVKKVCRTVSRRAAQLCAAGVAAVVEKIRENRDLDHLDIAVAVNGSLYENHPHFKDDMMSTLKTLAPCCKVAFLKSDSKGKGAALISAAAITAQKQIISLNDLSCQQLMYAI
ncbi:hypothetical protein XELAEV_18017317mg [Xenopus laevis]|uniref:Phosphotransferase n=1 Tax=Xenopus laevis TaxID=8355 RepID=A0A974DBC2_XENLA|nr:hypothetical protein XELAEV_18017317mg [Xenopus laevis]